MPMTPEDVQNAQFKRAFRGYDEIEVDAFLDQIEVELARLVSENEDLRQRLAAAAAAPVAQPVTSEAEEMLRRTLLLAQRTADETVAQAQGEAERLTTEARARATSLMEQAQQQAQASMADLDRRKQALEQQVEGLRAFEREYRTRLRAYLETQLRELEAKTGDGPAAPVAPARPAAAAAAPPVAATPAPAPAEGAAPVFTPVPPPVAATPEEGTEPAEAPEPEVPRLAP